MNKLIKILFSNVVFMSVTFAESITCPKLISCNHDDKECYYSETGELISDWWINENGGISETGNKQWSLGVPNIVQPKAAIIGYQIKTLEYPKGRVTLSCFYIQPENTNGSYIQLSKYVNSLSGDGWNILDKNFSIHSKYCPSNNPEECTAIN